MRFSLSWIQDYVTVEDSLETLANRLTMAGLPVDQIDVAPPLPETVVVGNPQCQTHVLNLACISEVGAGLVTESPIRVLTFAQFLDDRSYFIGVLLVVYITQQNQRQCRYIGCLFIQQTGRIARGAADGTQNFFNRGLDQRMIDGDQVVVTLVAFYDCQSGQDFFAACNRRDL